MSLCFRRKVVKKISLTKDEKNYIIYTKKYKQEREKMSVMAEEIKKIMVQERYTKTLLAKYIGTSVKSIDQMLQDNKDIKMKNCTAIINAMGHKIVLEKEGFEPVEITNDKPAMAAIKNCMEENAVTKTDLCKKLNRSKQNVQQSLELNKDMLSEKFVQYANALGYDVKIL